MDIAGRRNIHEPNDNMSETSNTDKTTSSSDSDSPHDETDFRAMIFSSDSSSSSDEIDTRNPDKLKKNTAEDSVRKRTNPTWREPLKKLKTDRPSVIEKHALKEPASRPNKIYRSIMAENMKNVLSRVYMDYIYVYMILINECIPNNAKNSFNKFSYQRLSWVSKFLILLTLLLFAFYIAFKWSMFSILKPLNMTLNEELKALSSEFPNQHDHIWKHFNLGLEKIMPTYKKAIIPAIFFIIQWSNKNMASKISEAVGNVAIRHIKEYEDTNLLRLSSNDINSLERGELISKYSKELESRHVMIVNGIENIKPYVAQDFRYYCDEENPVVHNAAIFLIMNIEKCNGANRSIFEDDEKTATDFVEQCLRDLWGGESGLDNDVLDPLIIRIVNGVLQIRS